ncbi:MAG: InlB B-repeat-containing protein [Paludibacteraceae bacterium]|nr:InlB B-repeat-containing protein [Paludibacteraceae bacterium]
MKKHLSLFGSLIAFMMLFAMPATAQVDEYLMIEGSATVNVKMTGTVTEWPDFWYSLDGGEWIKITEADTRIDVQGYSVSHPLTGYVRFKGTNPAGFNRSSTDYLSIAITGGNPALKGNVMSLIGGDNFSSLTAIPCDYCFYGLFCPNPPSVFSMSGTYHTTSSTTCLAHAKEMVLPATELKPYCYAYMFAYNTGLYDSPELPAMVMQPYCYAHMFEYCMNNFCSQTAYNSGTRLPNLPSQQLAEGCYAFMFNMCPSIYNGENDWYCLPAEELASRCYEGMFGTYRNSYYRYFKSLEIMATSLQDRCGNDIENCMKRMLNYNPMAQNAGQFGRGALNVRMYWTDWGNTTAGTAPTYGWFSGYLYSSCTFNYQKGLDPLTKVAKGSNSSNTMSSLFPYMCTLQENEFTYLTFDCKTNGGTWETGCTYNEDLRRVVRSDYTAKTVPADPVKEGVSFKGWYTAPTGGTKVEKAVILKQTTAQTYYAQFGEGGDDGGEGGSDNPEDETTYNIYRSTGVLDFPQYTTFSMTSKFAVIIEKDGMTVRLQFDGNISDAITSYKDFAANLSPADSYVELKDGTQRAVTSAQKAQLLYYGDYVRAAHLKATVFDADGRTYNIEVYTNELLNYATFKEDYRYKYNQSTLPIESSWVNGRSFQYNETNHLPNNFVVDGTNKTWRYFYGSSSPFDYCQILINFVVASGEAGIPTGYYPINSTLKPGTVFIGSIPCGDNAEIARSNNKNYACGGDASWIMHYYEEDYGGGIMIPVKDNWLLRGGYVQLVNNNGNYYIHVHAITDATRTNGESSNNVIDFTAGDESLADQLPDPVDPDDPGTQDDPDPDDPDDPDPETPIVSADAEVNVYQNVSKTTTKILYNLDMRQGKDGLWYKPTDMGYGIAWADRNVGAASESATGDYYNWGKTVVGPLPLSSTGYANVTSLNPGFTLPAKDDVATVKMGNDWHTPNYDEWNELITKTVGHGNLLANPDDEDLYINMPPTGHYDYYDGSSEVSPWLNYKSAAFLWTSELLEINTPGHWTNAGMVTNYTGSFEMNMGYIHLAAPVRAVYTPPFVTYTLTIRVGSYEYRYICQQGQKVTVTAIATETGAEFVKWEEDGQTDAVRTFTMTDDMAYTAVFTSNDEPEQPETPEMSPDAEVSVYQSVTETTMKILYDLRPRQGKDGLWYTPVDMGYGVAWADRNVGAGSVDALGDYFRWGDPVAGTSFSSDHQRNLDVTGYRTYDRLTDTQDAAIVNMGIEWRMPDEEDLYQLKEQSVITGNNTFTNKYDNTMYIVLPGGGYMGSKQYDNGWQYYWSRQFGQHGANSCSQGAGYGKEEYNSFALVRTGNNEYYVQTMDKDDCLGNETYLGMQVRGMFVPTFDVCTLTVNVEGYQYIYLCQDGQNVTVTAVANEGYEFDRWTEDNNTEAVRTFTVTGNMTYTATFKQAKQEYNIIYKDKGGVEFSGTHASGYPTVHTYGTATTLAGASKEGYNFLGWYLTADCTSSAVTTLGATAYTGDITLYASWEETVVEPEDPEDPENDELHIILYEDKTPDYYTDFSNKYNGKRATTVTYNRQFEKAKWSTLCLPFNVNAALLSVSKMTSRVYEFRYTEGNEESGLTLYFAQAKMLTAGKGYIVNANAKLAEKTQFVFPNVVIDTEADINSGFDIINLEGYNSQGDVYLVGVLRTGVLKGSETGNRYMGLKNNKIYYPNQDEGTNMRAYRGMFRSLVDMNVSKVRIVVEGEDGEQVSELEVVNGELKEVEPVRKYIENGVLYIERNGRRYTAQGALINDN